MRHFNPADNTEEKILCGMVAYLLLKNGYTESSICKALSVPSTFVSHMASDGVKIGAFSIGDKVCLKSRKSVRLDKTDFLACFRRITAPETPEDIFCEVYGMSKAELFWTQYYIENFKNTDPLNLMEDRKPRKIKNPVKVFVETRCDVGASHQCEAKELFRRWDAWRNKVGARKIPTQVLSRKLKELFPNIETMPVRNEEGGHSRKYIGIGLKPKPASKA